MPDIEKVAADVPAHKGKITDPDTLARFGLGKDQTPVVDFTELSDARLLAAHLGGKSYVEHVGTAFHVVASD